MRDGIDHKSDRAQEERPQHPEDLALAKAASSGDQDAKDRIAERFDCIPSLLRFAAGRRTQRLSKADLDDLAQRCAVLGLSKLDSYAGRASLETWLHAICSFELSNFVRREQTQRALFRPAESDSAPTTSDAVLASNAASAAASQLADDEAFLAALQPLDPTSRQIFEMRYRDGRTLREIAALLDLTDSFVKMRHLRGLETLRRARER